jgi:UDP-N-acetylmuramate dehydrogenase
MQNNVDLLPYNSFGIDVKAKNFLEIHSEEQALQFFRTNNLQQTKLLILGGGSNILLRKDFEGLVIKNSIKGINVREGKEKIYIQVGAGENWHQFVLYCIRHHYAGIENLALIPGCVGASPMQNIGAYGMEVKEVIESVEAVRIADGKKRIFSKAECEFDYRSSIFKTREKDNYFITYVNFILSKTAAFRLDYGAIREELKTLGVEEGKESIGSIAEAVIRIRQSKLPDPKTIGNAGSFFKNPVIGKQEYEELRAAFPEVVAYPAGEDFKIAAGWLIEKAGFKGFREGNIGVHDKQALVLVNHGGGLGEDIYRLSERIINEIKSRFGIELEREVNVIN